MKPEVLYIFHGEKSLTLDSSGEGLHFLTVIQYNTLRAIKEQVMDFFASYLHIKVRR